MNRRWNSINVITRTLTPNDAYVAQRNICVCSNNKILNITNYDELLERWKDGQDEKFVNYFQGQTGLPYRHNIHHRKICIDDCRYNSSSSSNVGHINNPSDLPPDGLLVSFSDDPSPSEVTSGQTLKNEDYSIEKFLGKELVPFRSLQVPIQRVQCSSQNVDDQTSAFEIKKESLKRSVENTVPNSEGISQEKCVSSVVTPRKVTSTNKVNIETEDLDSFLHVRELEQLINEADNSFGKKKFNGRIPIISNNQNIPVKGSIENKSVGSIKVQNYVYPLNKLAIKRKKLEAREIPVMRKKLLPPKKKIKTNKNFENGNGDKSANEVSIDMKSLITTENNRQKSLKPFVELSPTDVSKNQFSHPSKIIDNSDCINTETEVSSSNQPNSSSLSINDSNSSKNTEILCTERTPKNGNTKLNVCQIAPFQNSMLNNTNNSPESKKLELELKDAQTESKTLKFKKRNNKKYFITLNRNSTAGKRNISTILETRNIQNIESKISNLLEDLMSRKKSYNKKITDIISREKLSVPRSNVKEKSHKKAVESKSLEQPAETSKMHLNSTNFTKINKKKTSPHSAWNVLLTKQCLNKGSSTILTDLQPIDANNKSSSTIVQSPSIVQYEKQDRNKSSNLSSKLDLKALSYCSSDEVTKIGQLDLRCYNKLGKLYPNNVSAMKYGNKSAKMYTTDTLKLTEPIENDEGNVYRSIVSLSKYRNHRESTNVNSSRGQQFTKLKRTENTITDKPLSCVVKINDRNVKKGFNNQHIELGTSIVKEAYNDRSNFMNKDVKSNIIKLFTEQNSTTSPRTLKCEVKKPNVFNTKGKNSIGFSIQRQKSSDSCGIKLISSKKGKLFHHPGINALAFMKEHIDSKSSISNSEINNFFQRDHEQLHSDLNLTNAKSLEKPIVSKNDKTLSEAPLKKVHLQKVKTNLNEKYKLFIDSSWNLPSNISPNKYFAIGKSNPNWRSLLNKTSEKNKCNETLQDPTKNESLKNFIRQPLFKTRNLDSINRIVKSKSPDERIHNSWPSGFYFSSLRRHPSDLTYRETIL